MYINKHNNKLSEQLSFVNNTFYTIVIGLYLDRPTLVGQAFFK